MGVGVLELFGGDASTVSSIGWSDDLSLLRAVGFGTGIVMSEKYDAESSLTHYFRPGSYDGIHFHALVLIGWLDRYCPWMGNYDHSKPLVRSILTRCCHSSRMAWTGRAGPPFNESQFNLFLENVALGKVPAGEASVILATDPPWAAAFCCRNSRIIFWLE
jgi:hypothetical protein